MKLNRLYDILTITRGDVNREDPDIYIYDNDLDIEKDFDIEVVRTFNREGNKYKIIFKPIEKLEELDK